MNFLKIFIFDDTERKWEVSDSSGSSFSALQSPTPDRNIALNRKKPRAGPGWCGRSLLLMDRWAKEEEKVETEEERGAERGEEQSQTSQVCSVSEKLVC